MMQMDAEPRRFIPALDSLYERLIPLSWPLIRLTVGLMLIPHGWPKLMAGMDATAANAFERRGMAPALLLAYLITFLETIGGVCVAIGLFTRFFAAAIAVEMAVITYVYLPAGFGWTRPGYEYVLMWGLVMAAIALRGGGPYSVDRRLGVEL
jgi:putative oxidoreductase